MIDLLSLLVEKLMMVGGMSVKESVIFLLRSNTLKIEQYRRSILGAFVNCWCSNRFIC